ncbi:MAG TPA: hypothetical protein VHW44_29720 [Pseudonocardiaceae bacterium]|nr:hypothetical protein [Pseudonocardiaceae bacterium]
MGVVVSAACVLVGLSAAAGAAATPAPIINLNVLVVSDGTPWVQAIQGELTAEGVPTTVVNLADSARPALTSAYLSDVVGAVPRARFEGVVLPNQAPTQLSADELTALTYYEQQFGVRQVDSYVYPNSTVGLTAQWAGTIDGSTAAVTPAANAGAFRYLSGPVAIEDNDPAVSESYGYLATALPDDPTTGSHYEPYLTETIPGTSTQGALVGDYTSGSREQLVLSFAYTQAQSQFQLLGHGIVDWLTKGVHLGYYRNYFTLDVDDVFNADDRWNTTLHCTPGNNDCPPGTPDTTPIRMTPADVSYAVSWQQQNNFRFNLLYNGGASDDLVADTGSDPLLPAFQAVAGQFTWVNHTYDHEFLGCIQDFTVIPWQCVTDPGTGRTEYLDETEINSQINKNIQWAGQHGFTIDPTELVAGEHSGTFILPQQPADSPNFLAALQADGIRWLGLDASREADQRQVSSALGVPRHPMNVFYNVANPDEEVSEYNWIYTSRADGGSGVCEDNPATTTCITPLEPTTGYAAYIVPIESRIALGHILANDPRPHYVHQSNLAEGRIIYPVLDSILATYRGEFAASTPIVSPRLSAAAQLLQQQDQWQAALTAGSVTATYQGGLVTVSGPASVQVPVTVPTNTRVNTSSGPIFGQSYAGEQSAYTTTGSTGRLTLATPAASPATASGHTWTLGPATGGPLAGGALAGGATAPTVATPSVGALLKQQTRQPATHRAAVAPELNQASTAVVARSGPVAGAQSTRGRPGSVRPAPSVSPTWQSGPVVRRPF